MLQESTSTLTIFSPGSVRCRLTQDVDGVAKWPLPPRPLNPPRSPPCPNPRPRNGGPNPPLRGPWKLPRAWKPLPRKPPLPRCGGTWFPLGPDAEEFVFAPSVTESVSPDEMAVEGALCVGGPPPLIAPPRPRWGFAMIWTGPLCPRPLCAPWLDIVGDVKRKQGTTRWDETTHVWAAGRKPATGCIPGPGWIDGRGPNRGLNGACGFCT